MNNLNLNNQDTNKNMENNSDYFNRLLNLEAVVDDEVGISRDRTNNVIPLPLYVASSSFSAFGSAEAQDRHASILQNSFTNLPQSEPNNELEVYLPALCLLPLRLYGTDNIILLPQNDTGLSTSLSAGTVGFSVLSPNFHQIDAIPLFVGNAQENVLNLVYTQGADNTSLDNSQTFRLVESSLDQGAGQDLSGSSDNKSNTISSSSFEELTTFPITNAPSDCLWPSSEAVISHSPLHSSGNTSSFEEISFGKEWPTRSNYVFSELSSNAQAQIPASLHSQTSEIFRCHDKDYSNPNELVKRLVRVTDEENTFTLRTSSMNNETYNNTGAVPKNFWSNSYYPFVKSLGCKFCFKNKEPEYVYNSHELKSKNGIITCPVLRNYLCPICGVTGDFAHTVKYCPANTKNQLYYQTYSEEPLSSFSDATERKAVQLHSTPNNSLTQLSPQFYFEGQPIYQKATETHSGVQEQLTSETCFMNDQEVDVLNASFVPMNLSLKSTNANSSTITYDRFTCAFPSANIFKRKKKVCKFCLRNQEPPVVYNSHQLRDEDGNIECPSLRQFVCRICGATGDNAHTRKYCPENTYETFIKTVMLQ